MQLWDSRDTSMCNFRILEIKSVKLWDSGDTNQRNYGILEIPINVIMGF